MFVRDTFVDVTAEIPLALLDGESDPTAAIQHAVRAKADVLCAEVGGRLRTDRAPELIVRRATHKLTDEDVLLVACRWAAVVPDKVAADIG